MYLFHCSSWPFWDRTFQTLKKQNQTETQKQTHIVMLESNERQFIFEIFFHCFMYAVHAFHFICSDLHHFVVSPIRSIITDQFTNNYNEQPWEADLRCYCLNLYMDSFLDTAVSGEPDGRLTTSMCRKPTHTDQYLVYDSHHPQSVKPGIVKSL